MDKKYFSNMLDQRIGRDDPNWKYEYEQVKANEYPVFLYKYRQCNYIGFESLTRNVMEMTPLADISDKNKVFSMFGHNINKDFIMNLIWKNIGYLVYYYLPPMGNDSSIKLGHGLYYYQVNQNKYFDEEGNFRADYIMQFLPESFLSGNSMESVEFLIKMQQFEKERMKDRSTFEKLVEKLTVVFQKEIKLFCMSEAVDNQDLWDLYSDQNKGFVIEYDIQSWNKNVLKNLYPVEYIEDEFLDFSPLVAECADDDIYGFVKHNNPIVKKLYKKIFEKEKKFSKEKEWRLEMNQMQVPAPSIKRVYIGNQIEKQDEEKIIRICKEKGIQIYRQNFDKDGKMFFLMVNL